MAKPGAGRRGLVLAELMITMGIMVFFISVVYGLLGGTRAVFFDMSQGTELRDNLRQTMQKIELELRNTGFDGNGVAQFVISSGAGVNGTDIIRFSIPVTCNAALPLINAAGNPAYWGAILTWGCITQACMDADNSCAIQEYKYIRYAVDSTGQLVRSVLNAEQVPVATAVIGKNVSSLTFTYSAGTRTLTVALTSNKSSSSRRLVTETVSQNIRLMN
ncbi:MAG: hypothetical protein HQL20_06565 [Candidatus Omnitrophica bacterium]|nr:hypothetical protein [Candidatus Omnitrophota bacterium]